MHSTQNLIGNINKMDVTTLYYPINIEDTIDRTEKSILFFDSKNKIIKQIDQYSKFTDETIYNYNKDLLENIILKSGTNVTKIEYKYDNKKNIIDYRQLVNDSIHFIKTSTYDKKNNPIKNTYLHPYYKSNNGIENFEYDYKNRTVKIQVFDENNKIENHYLKIYFDNNGYQIKTEFIYTDLNKDYSTNSKIEYDKFGNLIRRTTFDKDGKIKNSTEYKNTYDKKGNLIMIDEYSDEKLIERTTYQITYR